MGEVTEKIYCCDKGDTGAKGDKGDTGAKGDKGYSFQIGSVNIAKLSDEQKAIATNKGWTLI